MEQKRLVNIWLLSLLALIVLMIAVGGVTRLTRSGLSIVEWKPVHGFVPPLTEADWQNQFDLYRQSPEYQKINSHFELADYKKIFMWEFGHRVLGRIIFLVALVPGLVLWRRRLVSGKTVVVLSGLVVMQGVVGWVMVRSGLVDRPHVSPYLLALHFFSALILMVVTLLYWLRQKPGEANAPREAYRLVKIVGVLLALQLFYGCLVAGLKAGFSYNTYPLMAGEFFPSGAFSLEPMIFNFFENIAFVQWIHRWLGIVVFAAMIVLAVKAARWPTLKGEARHFLGMGLIQVVLGVLNIVWAVPIVLGVLHQVLAALLVISYVRLYVKSAVSNV